MKKPISIVVKSSPTMNLSISAHFYFDIRLEFIFTFSTFTDGTN